MYIFGMAFKGCHAYGGQKCNHKSMLLLELGKRATHNITIQNATLADHLPSVNTIAYYSTQAAIM